jgi:hypothetical protein
MFSDVAGSLGIHSTLSLPELIEKGAMADVDVPWGLWTTRRWSQLTRAMLSG